MAYQSEAALEQQFIEQLNKQGYTSVSIPDYDALVENFKTQFAAFNAAKLDSPLTPKEWERVLNIMLGKSVFQSAKILRDKFVLEREDGTKVYLSFFDADHTKNIFQVTNQTTVVGKYHAFFKYGRMFARSVSPVLNAIPSTSSSLWYGVTPSKS